MDASELKAWRVGARLTQDQGAVALKIGRRALANYEAGRRPVPDKVAAAIAATRASVAESGALPLPEPAPAKRPRKAKVAAAPPAKPDAGLFHGEMRKPSPALVELMKRDGWQITAVEILHPASGHGEISMRLHGRKLANWKPPPAKIGPGDFQPYAAPIRRARFSRDRVQAS